MNKTKEKKLVFRANSENQRKFLNSTANIVIYGGSAAGGKTYAMLLDIIKNIYKYGNLNIALVREKEKSFYHGGGLADEAKKLFPKIGGVYKISQSTFFFKEFGSQVVFQTLNDINREAWKGSQFDCIYYDEVTEITEDNFFYAMSRNRGTSGLGTYIRATCNPTNSSWVRKFINYWVKPDGFANEELFEKKRYFLKDNQKYYWFNSIKEFQKKFPKSQPISLSFIGSKLEDNTTFLETNPYYGDRLRAAGGVSHHRLYEGNWNYSDVKSAYFNRDKFKVIKYEEAMRNTFKTVVRAWDLAATAVPTPSNPNPSYTVGIKVARTLDDKIYVLDMVRVRLGYSDATQFIIDTALKDGNGVIVRVSNEGGAAGHGIGHEISRKLVGYEVSHKKMSSSKIIRAGVCSTQVGNNNVYIIENETWNEIFLCELESFGDGIAHDDIVDAFGDAMDELADTYIPPEFVINDLFISL